MKTLVFSVLPMQPMSRLQRRAMTEAALCRTLQHPNIIATYAYDLHPLHSGQQQQGQGQQTIRVHHQAGGSGKGSGPPGEHSNPLSSDEKMNAFAQATEFKVRGALEPGLTLILHALLPCPLLAWPRLILPHLPAPPTTAVHRAGVL